MEHVNLLHSQKKNLQSSTRKLPKSGPSKDLWLVVRGGSVVDVESALVVLKKNGGNINSRNAFGLTPLHVATWRNHTPIVKRLLEAGADPNARDGESGWTSLHRALHFGHLAVASVLKSDASIAMEDSKSRTPVDLLSGPVLQANGKQDNSEGQLGYTSVNTQAKPRRVSSLKSKIVAVAAANKHTAVVSDLGEVFTWGCNKEGQLGYGTSNSGSNYTPRVVEYLKGEVFVGVAAAKYHTMVLGVEGEVFTWGHRLVTPRRVVVARIIKKSGSIPLEFHHSERLHVVARAARMIHSSALTDDGAWFYWVSSEPNLRCQQLCMLCGKSMVSISSGKYWTTGATASGDVYMWDGKKRKDEPPVVTRLHGVKRATSVSVGETQLLVISSLYHPPYSLETVDNPQGSKPKPRDELDEEFAFNDTLSNEIQSSAHTNNVESKSVPTLKSLCEKVAAENLLEPRSAVQRLEIADSLEADDLRKRCEVIYVIAVPTVIFVPLQDILVNLEKSLDSKSSEAWSHRQLPTTTATFPAIIDSEEEDSDGEFFRTRDNNSGKLASKRQTRNLAVFFNRMMMQIKKSLNKSGL